MRKQLTSQYCLIWGLRNKIWKWHWTVCTPLLELFCYISLEWFAYFLDPVSYALNRCIVLLASFHSIVFLSLLILVICLVFSITQCTKYKQRSFWLMAWTFNDFWTHVDSQTLRPSSWRDYLMVKIVILLASNHPPELHKIFTLKWWLEWEWIKEYYYGLWILFTL